MPETPSFVVNDRRKFTADGDLRPEAPVSRSAHESTPDAAASAETRGPQLVSSPIVAAEGVEAEGRTANQAELRELPDLPESAAFSNPDEALSGMDAFPEDSEGTQDLPPGPTPEQAAEAARAYDATVERLDLALRANDPGGERLPEMNFERLTQSLYTQALLLLGGATQPGETPRVDILGARQTIDMLHILAEKSRGNLTPNEDNLLQSALFDLRMGFLEITQALARQARQGIPGQGGAPGMMPGAGPRIVS